LPRFARRVSEEFLKIDIAHLPSEFLSHPPVMRAPFPAEPVEELQAGRVLVGNGRDERLDPVFPGRRLQLDGNFRADPYDVCVEDFTLETAE
jgi:hypothetical protein